MGLLNNPTFDMLISRQQHLDIDGWIKLLYLALYSPWNLPRIYVTWKCLISREAMPSPVDTGSIQKRKKACRRCRHRKQRCDFEQPCHNCEAAGVGMSFQLSIVKTELRYLRMYSGYTRNVSELPHQLRSGSWKSRSHAWEYSPWTIYRKRFWSSYWCEPVGDSSDYRIFSTFPRNLLFSALQQSNSSCSWGRKNVALATAINPQRHERFVNFGKYWWA